MEGFKGAWHGDPALKARVMIKLRRHREQDELVRGVYQEKYGPEVADGYKGCLVGCTLPWIDDIEHGDLFRFSYHGRLETEYGIPVELARLLDDLFEATPTDACADFAVDSIEAIQPGADLDGIAEEYADWLAAHTRSYIDEYGDNTKLIELIAAAPVIRTAGA